MTRDSTPVTHFLKTLSVTACGRERAEVWFHTRTFDKVTCSKCISRTPARKKI